VAGGPTTTVFELDSRAAQSIDPATSVTSYSFDNFGNDISQSLPAIYGAGYGGSPTTTFTYNYSAVGR
jgi:hypothetical protein